MASVATSPRTYCEVCMYMCRITSSLTGPSNDAGQTANRVLHLLGSSSLELGRFVLFSLLRKLPKLEPGTF